MSTFLEKLVHYVAYSMEIIGILIIIMSGIKALYLFVKDGFKFHNRLVSLTLAEGLSMSLGFLLAAEISLSMVIKTIPNLIVLIGIAALRVGLTFVLHWEIKEYEKIADEEDPRGQHYEKRLD
ncbi:MAG: DUF1622 domain-containing protein [Tissierellia bacterium]|nr:DUF1622 domain-containing protein [Tissierellia bacterium]